MIEDDCIDTDRGVKWSIILALFTMLGVLTFSEVSVHGARDVILVGGNRAYPPYTFLDHEGKPAGYNVDLIKAIADVMGVSVDVKLGPWDQMRKALESGAIDALSGISYSEARTKVVDFSHPHTIIHHSIYARKGAAVVGSLEELRGQRVALHKGGVIHDFFSEHGYEPDFLLTETPAEALILLSEGRADYAVVATLPATYLLQELNLTNIVPVANKVAVMRYCFAVKKGNSELLALLDEGLAILKKTGRYQAIHNKWLGVLEQEGIPWGKALKYGAGVLIPLLLVLAGTMLWSQTLKRQVSIRTAELQREVEERQRAVEELRRHQQQLIQADKMASLGVLVAGVAHEINNPNGLILHNMPTVIETFSGIEPVLDLYYREHGDFAVGGLSYSRLRSRMPYLLQEMLEGSKRIARIVEDLKNFARKDDIAVVETFDLNDVVKASVRLLDKTIRKSTDHITTNYGEHLLLVKGSPQRIEQVVVNLILNACQALEDRRQGIMITTCVDRDINRVVLQVTDQGVGIEPEHMSYLTDPFFTTKRERGGTGLGLSVSVGIIKEHSGTLEFDSAVGKGTSVTVKLPIVERA